ncbi:unnamed protein product [Cochlearia groenlandica]
MEGREAAMSYTGGPNPPPPPPFFYPIGAFTSQSAIPLHAPPGFRPIFNFPNSQPPPGFVSHGIHMGMVPSPSMQQPNPPPPRPPPPPTAATTVVKEEEKRGRPRKYVPDNPISEIGFSSSLSDPNAPKRARGRPPGSGRKQRLASLGEWINSSAGHAFTPHLITVESGEDIVSKVLCFSKQKPRALCIMSGMGSVSDVTLCQTGSIVPTASFEGDFKILSLGGSYLVDEEGESRSRIGGITVSLPHPDGYLIGGGAVKLIAASLVQVVVCSFTYLSPKAKKTKQENSYREDDNNNNHEETQENKNMDTPNKSEAATESAAEAAQTPPGFSGSGWSEGSGSGNRSSDSRDNNNLTDIDLTRG